MHEHASSDGGQHATLKDTLCMRLFIAIMARGRLCCLGSALHLKQRYGVGYQVCSIEEASLAPWKAAHRLACRLCGAEMPSSPAPVNKAMGDT